LVRPTDEMREHLPLARAQLDLARVFFSKARQDLEALVVLSRSDVVDEIVGFHAQQAVEKDHTTPV